MSSKLDFPSFFDEDVFGAEVEKTDEESGADLDSETRASTQNSKEVSPDLLPETIPGAPPSEPQTERTNEEEQEDTQQTPPMPIKTERKTKVDTLPEEKKNPTQETKPVSQPSPVTSNIPMDETQAQENTLPEEKNYLSEHESESDWREDNVPSLLDSHPEVSSILNVDALLKIVEGDKTSSPKAPKKNTKKRKKKKSRKTPTFGEFVKNHQRRMESDKPINTAWGLDDEYSSSSSGDYYSKPDEHPRPDFFTKEDFDKMGPPRKIDDPEKFVDDLFKDIPGWDTKEYEKRSEQIRDFRSLKANCLLCIIVFVFGHLWYMDYTRDSKPRPSPDVKDIEPVIPARIVDPYKGEDAEKIGPLFKELSGSWSYEGITFTQLIPGVVEVIGLPLDELGVELEEYNFFDKKFCKVSRSYSNRKSGWESFGARAVWPAEEDSVDGVSQLFLARLIEQVAVKLFPNSSWDEFNEIQRVEVLVLKKRERLISGPENPATSWSSRYTMLHFIKESKTILTFPLSATPQEKMGDNTWPLSNYNRTEVFSYRPKPKRSILIRNIASKSSQLPTAFWELKAGAKSYVVRQSF